MKKIFFILIVSVFLILYAITSIYTTYDDILGNIDYQDVTSIEVRSTGIFGQRMSGNETERTITDSKQIKGYISKIKRIRLYKASEEQFGQQDYTTLININKSDGSTVEIFMVSIQMRVTEYNPERIINSSVLYNISPLSWVRFVHAF